MARPRSFHDPDILTRAMLVFWQSGFSGSHVRQLEAATGLKVSSLYHRFGSKERLFQEVLDHYLDKVVGWRVRRYLLDSADPLAGIGRFIHSCYDYIDSTNGRPPVACLLSNSALEFGQRDPAVTERLARGMALVTDGLEQALLRAQDQQQLDQATDTKRLARQLALGVQGVLVHSKVTPDKQQLTQLANDVLAMIPGRKL